MNIRKISSWYHEEQTFLDCCRKKKIIFFFAKVSMSGDILLWRKAVSECISKTYCCFKNSSGSLLAMLPQLQWTKVLNLRARDITETASKLAKCVSSETSYKRCLCDSSGEDAEICLLLQWSSFSLLKDVDGQLVNGAFTWDFWN